MSKIKKNKLIKELEETLIKKGIEIDGISDVLKKIENNLKDKKYGLVWEEHTEEIEKELLTNFPILKEEKELRIEKEIKGGNKLTNNFLIEGDNLESLTALKNMGKKVDVIYVDPPYNTGNRDFVYEDSYVDIDDSFKHSKWLSFKEKRLKLAKDLLTEDGVIFVSIDDNEQANLKLLCDSVFGEFNFISQISRVTKRGGSKGKNINPNADYILIYAKNKEQMKTFNKIMDDEYLKRYKFEDDKGRYLLDGFFRPSMKIRPNQRYYLECPDGTFIIPNGQTFPENIGAGEQVRPRLGDGVWRWSRDRYLSCKDEVVFKKSNKPSANFVDHDGNPSYWNVYKKVYLDVYKSGVLQEQVQTKFLNSQGTESLKNMGIEFDFSKPVGLVEWCVSLVPNPNATVLDFFAGSGTTGHAVLELNKEYGGNRNFILCTNNENNISRDVTYQRLNKVINGYTTPKGKEVEGISANLTYLKTELVEKEEDLVDLGVDDTLKESMVNNLKVKNNVTKVDELTEDTYKLEGSEEDYYLHFDFYIDDSIKKINISENKKNVVYVTEDNLTDVSLSMFDEVRSLNDLLVYK